MLRHSSARIDLLIVLICLGALLFAAYLQYHESIAPCPLCVMQRLILIMLSLVSVSCLALHYKHFACRIPHRFNLITTLFGAGLAIKQLWLEHHWQSHLISCRESFEGSIQSLGLTKIFNHFFDGNSDCGTTQWRFLSFSLSAWTLFLFILLIILIGRQIYLDRKEKNNRQLFSY
jgi:protein dithiol:quinone oxidoreductase